MGQSASKAAGRAAQRAANSAKPSPSAATRPSAPPQQPLPTSNISASAAAAEATSTVRPPSFDTNPSPHDLSQQQLLKESKGEVYQEMPDDLVSFLKDAGPLHKEERQESPERRKEPRLPRQPWQGEATKSDRRQESMPLAEKIEGFETTKSTSFSRSDPEIKKEVYRKGTTLDMYELLSQKPANGGSQSFKQIVAQVYDEYKSEFALPDESEQAKHKELLANTLKYLDLPVIMKDNKDNQESYDGIHPQQVDIYEIMKYDVLPKTRARLVLEDLHELERKEET